MHDPIVRAWVARPVDVDAATLARLQGLLDGRELARLAGLRFEPDRRAYTVAHGLLRLALSQVIGCPPRELRFGAEGAGRPVLEHPDPAVCFSLSRSREGVGVAITRAGPIGIDVEPLVSTSVDGSLLARYFSSPPTGVDAATFYEHWSALEAFWKAMGTGLADGNPRIVCTPDGPARFEVRRAGVDIAHAAAHGWRSGELPGCATAVVVAGVKHSAPAAQGVAFKLSRLQDNAAFCKLFNGEAAHETLSQG